MNENLQLTGGTAAPFETILYETPKQQAIAWAELHIANNEKSDAVTQDLFL